MPTVILDDSAVQDSPGLSHVELGDQVYVALKQMIFDQELKPGQKIVQDAVAARLGVSRSPLSKALQRLENEMLVERQPRRGVFVKELTLVEYVEIFQCRAMLGLSASLAAEKAAPEDVAALRALFAPFEGAVEASQEAYSRADREFHRAIMALGGNSIVQRLETVNNVYFMASQVDPFRSPADTLPEHLAVIDAIAVGDGPEAERCMRHHVDESRRAVERGYREA